MSYHTNAVRSADFIASLRQARRIADAVRQTLDASGHTDVVFFPYSVFYVYYEQYLTIWSDALFSLGVSLATIGVVTFVLTGFDVVSALLVFVMVAMIVVNMGGMMWLWGITLNAVSLVNLVVVSVPQICAIHSRESAIDNIYVFVCLWPLTVGGHWR